MVELPSESISEAVGSLVNEKQEKALKPFIDVWLSPDQFSRFIRKLSHKPIKSQDPYFVAKRIWEAAGSKKPFNGEFQTFLIFIDALWGTTELSDDSDFICESLDRESSGAREGIGGDELNSMHSRHLHKLFSKKLEGNELITAFKAKTIKANNLSSLQRSLLVRHARALSLKETTYKVPENIQNFARAHSKPDEYFEFIDIPTVASKYSEKLEALSKLECAKLSSVVNDFQSKGLISFKISNEVISAILIVLLDHSAEAASANFVHKIYYLQNEKFSRWKEFHKHLFDENLLHEALIEPYEHLLAIYEKQHKLFASDSEEMTELLINIKECEAKIAESNKALASIRRIALNRDHISNCDFDLINPQYKKKSRGRPPVYSRSFFIPEVAEIFSFLTGIMVTDPGDNYQADKHYFLRFLKAVLEDIEIGIPDLNKNIGGRTNIQKYLKSDQADLVREAISKQEYPFRGENITIKDVFEFSDRSGLPPKRNL